MQSIADIAEKIEPGKHWQVMPTTTARISQRVTLDTLDTSHPQVAAAVQSAREWAERKRDNYDDASLILSGPYGTGKTHIAKAILWSIRDEVPGQSGAGVPAGRFFLANDLLLNLAPLQNKMMGIVTPPDVNIMVGTAPLVVIDDIGGQQMIPFVRGEDQEHERHARYFKFIDYCYTYQISVIITTNLSIAAGVKSQFAQHIGGRAFDRLSEMAPVGFMVGLQGVQSWRMKKAGR
jgi:DNA replication protein DnaC